MVSFLGFEISLTTKGLAVISDAGAGERMVARLCRWQFRFGAAVKVLGVDFGLGPKVKWHALRSGLARLGRMASTCCSAVWGPD